MFRHFRDYYWKEGKPYGRGEVDPLQTSFSYKIVIDPYYKRFSVEKYRLNVFEKVIYDSCLLDFRHLTLKDQMAWQREVLKEEKEHLMCLLRNQEDRAILMEELTFEHNQCCQCITRSVHGILLSVHRMYYCSRQDAFNGVVLYDLEDRPVMIKIYDIDPVTGEFTDLLSEEWNMQTPPSLTCLN